MCREDTSTGKGLADEGLHADSRDPGKGAKGPGERAQEQAGGEERSVSAGSLKTRLCPMKKGADMGEEERLSGGWRGKRPH